MPLIFAADLRELMRKHITRGLGPEYAGAVLCVAAGAALHVIDPKLVTISYASEHIDKASFPLSPLLPSAPLPVPPTELK